MTSTSIYTSITPTYLYIKQHSVTKKKYFGKTTKKDPYKYLGSGFHWVNHYKKHGKEHIKTLWVSDYYYDTSIVEVALHFSKENNIVESTEWLNLKPENGLDGGSQKGRIVSLETRSKLSKLQSNQSEKTRLLRSAAQTGKNHSDEHKAKNSAANKGKTRTEESKKKMSDWQKGVPKRIEQCPHCNKSGGVSNMTRYHFDNCKLKT